MMLYLNPQMSPETLSNAGSESKLVMVALIKRNVLPGTTNVLDAKEEDILKVHVNHEDPRLKTLHKSSRMPSLKQNWELFTHDTPFRSGTPKARVTSCPLTS